MSGKPMRRPFMMHPALAHLEADFRILDDRTTSDGFLPYMSASTLTMVWTSGVFVDTVI